MIGAAVESALAQSDDEFEVLVVDNASTDSTLNVLSRLHAPRLRIVRNERTVSMYANHNICVRHATAPWVVFLHSDDQLTKAALAILRGRIEEASCDVVYPAALLHRPYVSGGDMFLAGRKAVPSLLRWPAGTPSGAAFSKRLLSEIGFDESVVVADFLLLAQTLLRGGTIVISADSTVAIGHGKFQYSSAWHRSGGFIRDVSKGFKQVIDTPGVLDEVVRQVTAWSDSEIAFMLLMLSHADEREAIRMIEAELGSRASYKHDLRYRHVSVYKLLGWWNLRALFAAAKIWRNL